MTKTEQLQSFDKYTSDLRELIEEKGDDYSADDRLSNFKLSGSIIHVSASSQCLSAIATKVARLGVLINLAKNPKNESIKDSCLDLANYAFLLAMINDENSNSKFL